MNSKSTLLLAVCLVSVAANAAFAYLLARPSPAPAANRVLPTSQASVATPVQNQATSANPTPAVAVPADQLWSRLHSNDLKQLVANLRAAGFDAKTIRNIIQTLVSEKYAEQMLVARGQDKDTPYWKTSNVYYSGDKRMKETQRLHREMSKETRAALGDDSSMLNDESLPSLQRQFGNLPPEKLSKLLRIQEDYSDMMREYQTGGSMLPADKEKHRLLRKEQQADIAKLLTPEEFYEYELRNNPASSQLRGWSGVFDLTESEYRNLFPLYKTLEEQFPSDQGTANYKDRQKAEENLQDQIKAILGDARYADFKQSRDPNAYQENRLVLRLGIPLSAATTLLAEQKSFREATSAIMSNKELSGDQKREQRATLLQATESRLTTLLGDRGLKIYRDYGGNWLQSQ